MTTLPKPVAIQFWSHQEITAQIRERLETILSGHGEQQPHGPNVDPLPAQSFQEGGDALRTSVTACSVENMERTSDSVPRLSNAAPTSEPERAADNPNIKQTAAGIWVLVNDENISRWVEEKGALQHDYETLPQILEEIHPGDTVIDVGAFIGDTTAPFLERVGPKGKVIAFEPNRDAWECLKRNCPGAICHNFALGSSISLLGLAANENAGARHLQVADSNEETVNIGTLDALELSSCDFIKIDVEGFELRVLKGAEQTVNRFHPELLIEVNEAALQRQGARRTDILDWLHDHGYKPMMVQSKLAWTSPQFDVLCTYCPTANELTDTDWQQFERDSKTESVSTAQTSIIKPWESKEQSLAQIRELAAELKKFCGNSANVRAVRLELHKLGVISLPYRFKRRGKWRKKK